MERERLKQQAYINYDNALKEFESQKDQEFEQYLKKKMSMKTQ